MELKDPHLYESMVAKNGAGGSQSGQNEKRNGRGRENEKQNDEIPYR